MDGSNYTIISHKWLHLLLGVVLLICFFLPWVSWNGISISGYYMPAGKFFDIAESKFGLGNPFPQFNFTLYIFWLIPLLAVIVTEFVLVRKKAALFSFIAGALSLSLITVFFLFTRTLVDLGVGNNVFSMLNIPIYIEAFCAIGLILTAFPVKTQLPKIIWLITGPVIAYAGYKIGEKQVMSDTFKTTEQVKADYTVKVNDLINEFATNDSAANKKYLEKTIVINGNASAIEILSDSTSTIKFFDSTKYFVIFSLETNQFNKVKTIKPGDAVSLKGVCSGSVYSEILDSTSINFKRSLLIKTTQQ